MSVAEIVSPSPGYWEPSGARLKVIAPTFTSGELASSLYRPALK